MVDKMEVTDLTPFMTPTTAIESTHPDVIAFTAKHASGAKDTIETSVRLFYVVRNSIRYDPYAFILSVDGLKASYTLQAGRAWCVPKAILLAACCRSMGIPAKLGYADVRNHLSTARMRQNMRTDIFHWHGYTSIYLDGRWLKATPAFNIELCRKFNLLPLDFDGRSDALFHAFDADGNRHMEYVNYRGEFADVPIDAMEATFREAFPELWITGKTSLGDGADFDKDVEAEISGTLSDMKS
ncbi:MAG: transglutaminase family protein [Syntrophales bacterium]|jgi:transglutaminase-like putative cysteine protease